MNTENVGLLWGAKAIANYLELTPAQIYHMHNSGSLPTWKEGAIVCASKSSIAKWLAEREAAARANTEAR